MKARLQNDIFYSSLSQGGKDFLSGKSDVLSVADLYPELGERLKDFLKAMEYKKSGNITEAEKLLLKSTNPPSIFTGHYRELFKIWRQQNRECIKAGRFNAVEERVLKMVILDDEMITKILKHWGDVQNCTLPSDYFDKSRNLLVSDVKALKKAAEALNHEDSKILADKLLRVFIERRK